MTLLRKSIFEKSTVVPSKDVTFQLSQRDVVNNPSRLNADMDDARKKTNRNFAALQDFKLARLQPCNLSVGIATHYSEVISEGKVPIMRSDSTLTWIIHAIAGTSRAGQQTNRLGR